MHIEAAKTMVALKRVNPAVIGEPAFVQLVVREAEVLTRFKHPSLCRCLEMGVVDGSAFLTLDLVEGCTLRALLRRLALLGKSLPVTAVVSLGIQLAQVLDYCHRQCTQPIVHLDLSPQNVMIARDGQLKLIDFGIARYLDGHNPPPLGGKIAGTVGYMSPEQASGWDLTPRADQFGLGILLWEMLAARRLFRGNSDETWRRMRTGDVPLAETTFPRLPQKLSMVVYRLLAPHPDRRYEHMDEAAAALRGCISTPRSGRKPLASMVQKLLDDPGFDPFDSRHAPQPLPPPAPDIPEGEGEGSDYEELDIQVDHGLGSPTSQLRAVVPGASLPDSPFLETIPELPATGLLGGP